MLSAAKQTPDSASAAPRGLVVFGVGSQEFCVDIAAVKEIRCETPAAPIPRSPAYMRGVVNLRGTVLPIVDLGARLNLPAGDSAVRHAVMVVWIDGKLMGLLVDTVSDILTVTDDALQSTPEVACETVHTLVKSIVTVDGRMIGLLALEQILPPLEDAYS